MATIKKAQTGAKTSRWSNYSDKEFNKKHYRPTDGSAYTTSHDKKTKFLSSDKNYSMKNTFDESGKRTKLTERRTLKGFLTGAPRAAGKAILDERGNSPKKNGGIMKKAQNGVSKSSKPAPKPTAKPAATPKPKPKTASQRIGDITLRDIKNAGEDALNLSTLGMYGKAKKKVKEVTGLKNGGSLKAVGANKPGLKKLPTAVRNKMGYQKNGGATKAKCGAKMSKKK